MSRKKPPTGKPLSAPASVSSSPATSQPKISELVQREAAGETSTDPSVKQMLQEIMNTLKEMKDEYSKVKIGLDQVQTRSIENQLKIVGVEERTEELSEVVKGVRKGTAELENFMVKAEFERMSLFLRFQNIPEVENQDLKDVMCTMLAEYLGKDKKQLYWDVDLVYRVNSTYAKLHGVPREVHVKFLRRTTRDEVLWAQRGGQLKYQEKEIAILKQIPKKIREKRRKYSSLAKKLYNTGVWFRWLLPEGMLIFGEEGRTRIKTVEEADAFVKKHFPSSEDKDLDVGGGGGVGDAGGEGPSAPPGGREGETIAARLRSQK